MQKTSSVILSLFLASLVLFSSTGIAIGSHYCQGKRVQTSLFHQAEGCGMESNSQQTNCPAVSNSPTNKGSLSLSQAACCYDDFQIVQSEITQSKTQAPQLQELAQLISLLQVFFQPLFSTTIAERSPRTHLAKAPPPLLPRQQHLRVFVQSFLC